MRLGQFRSADLDPAVPTRTLSSPDRRSGVYGAPREGVPPLLRWGAHRRSDAPAAAGRKSDDPEVVKLGECAPRICRRRLF